MNRYSSVVIGSKYDIALSSVAEVKNSIWHKFAEQDVQVTDAVS